MKIYCNVDNCSHNKSGTCYSDRVNIEGKGAKSIASTCCSSFLDKRHYSTLTNNTNSSGSCDCIVCGVTKCQYNDNKLCMADSITVNGNNVNIYIETHCNTFKLK